MVVQFVSVSININFSCSALALGWMMDGASDVGERALIPRPHVTVSPNSGTAQAPWCTSSIVLRRIEELVKAEWS